MPISDGEMMEPEKSQVRAKEESERLVMVSQRKELPLIEQSF